MLISRNSTTVYSLKLEPDGLLKLLKSEGTGEQEKILWHSNSKGLGKGPYTMKLVEKGNLAIFDSQGLVIWNTNTSNKGVSPCFLILKNNGSLVLKDGQE